MATGYIYLNLHPVFVHFPIALFTIYSILELVRFKKIMGLAYWFYIKAVLVILGTASAYVTLISGQVIEERFENVHNLVELHSFWANISTLIFTIIASTYVFSWYKKQFTYDFSRITCLKQIWGLAQMLQHFVLETKLIILLALVGLAAITATGALGGIIAFGPDTDPLTKFVYLLFLQK